MQEGFVDIVGEGTVDLIRAEWQKGYEDIGHQDTHLDGDNGRG